MCAQYYLMSLIHKLDSCYKINQIGYTYRPILSGAWIELYNIIIQNNKAFNNNNI